MTVFVGFPEGCRYHTASAVYDLVLFYYRQPCVAMRRLCFATVYLFFSFFLFNSRSQKLLDRFS